MSLLSASKFNSPSEIRFWQNAITSFATIRYSSLQSSCSCLAHNRALSAWRPKLLYEGFMRTMSFENTLLPDRRVSKFDASKEHYFLTTRPVSPTPEFVGAGSSSSLEKLSRSQRLPVSSQRSRDCPKSLSPR